MDRRLFMKIFAGLLTISSLPKSLHAKSPIGNQAEFLQALKEKPWLLGYLGTDQLEIRADLRIVSGRVPSELQGYFFRNGPALHNIGPDRFKHWFDAPGMVQKFTFADGVIRFHGRLVGTRRNRTEAQRGNILFSAFGTHGHDLSSGGSADGQNVANINIVRHADDLLALWEGGSAYLINAETLETKGPKVWSPETAGLPFGAHPRFDQDGSMWNIGYSVNPAALILYHISAGGHLLKTHILPQMVTLMIHDFMITESKIVIVAPPYVSSKPKGESFIDKFEWQGAQPTRTLVIDKNNLTKVTDIELDPFWVFHFGNAYDISPTEIGFDFVVYDNPDFMTREAFSVMDGSWDGQDHVKSRYAQAILNLTTKTAVIDHFDDFGPVEFIRTDDRENLTQHKQALMLSRSTHSGVYGFSRLNLYDRQSESNRFFDVSTSEILEEHIMVPKQGHDNQSWIIGTALDWKKGLTNLSVYDGAHLSDGPIVKAELDLALPLGLHGNYVAR
ncbi:MAG: carotenoid oxygenase family protein [Aestuariivita sp.]|nr:carotenoid oxygenase family protein [Aestuariivita sp.]MCY4201586.1 carotenoid oxygenase family protein [Aestuariivita sp.]